MAAPIDSRHKRPKYRQDCNFRQLARQSPPILAMLETYQLEIRVRYQETDAMGRLHHANYINYFEIGRIELMRAAGHSYRQCEEQGIYLVVAEISCQYFLPAVFDDLLTLRTTTVRAKGARIEHHYELRHDDDLLATGRSLIACVSAEGKPRRLPTWASLT